MELVSCVILQLLLVEAVLGEPKAQGTYQQSTQFAGAQPVQLQFAPSQQQQQQAFIQPQFLAAQPAAPGVFDAQQSFFLPQAAQPIQQVILPSNVDRQV